MNGTELLMGTSDKVEVMTVFSNINENQLLTLISQIIVPIAKMLFLIFLGGCIIYLVWHKQKHKKEVIGGENEKGIIEAKGKPLVIRNRIGSLFVSDNMKNKQNIGKILACIPVFDTNENKNKTIFVTKKKSYHEKKYFLVNKEEHTELKGDVVLKKWNFKIYAGELFHTIKNEIKFNPQRTDIPNDVKLDVGVDVLRRFSPKISSAIQTNFRHLLAIRENKLIKAPSETKMRELLHDENEILNELQTVPEDIQSE